MGNVTFRGNKAPLSADEKYGYGAAIHIDQASKVTIYGQTVFDENVSNSNGGAIYITKKSTLNVRPQSGASILFEQNVSTVGNGGAIYNSASAVTIDASLGAVILRENVAMDGNGGAIAVHSEGVVLLYNATLTKNQASKGNGGALYVYGGKAVIGDAANNAASRFTYNAAAKGGAIYLSATSTANAEISAFFIVAENNSSSGGGGAVYVQANDTHTASFTAGTLTLRKNEAGGNGGALYAYTSAKLTIGILEATENKASDGYGGVLYVSGKANVLIDCLTATENSASSGGCIYLTTAGTVLTINGGDIRGNTASSANKGNAVWVNSASSVLRLKTNAQLNYILTFEAEDVLGKNGFEITKYQEVAE